LFGAAIEKQTGRLGRRLAAARGSVSDHLYLDLNHDPDRAILVVGSGRSGTTWLAELLSRQLRARLVFEPFHPHWSPARDRLRLFVAPEESDAGFRQAAAEILAGRLRSGRLEQAPPIRFPRSRIVKDIHVMNALPWFRRQFPRLPLVLIIRHPLAVALSRVRSGAQDGTFAGLAPYLGTAKGQAEAGASPVARWLPTYNRFRADREPLVQCVAEWCIENTYPAAVADAYGIKLCFYEDLVLDPHGVLADLTAELGVTGGGHTADPARPSSTDWFARAASARTGAARERLLVEWQEQVAPATTARCLAVLDEFGLTHLYDDGAIPVASRNRQ